MSSERLGWVAAGSQSAIWVALALLAWPDQMVVLAKPWVVTFVWVGVVEETMQPAAVGVWLR